MVILVFCCWHFATTKHCNLKFWKIDPPYCTVCLICRVCKFYIPLLLFYRFILQDLSADIFFFVRNWIKYSFPRDGLKRQHHIFFHFKISLQRVFGPESFAFKGAVSRDMCAVWKIDFLRDCRVSNDYPHFFTVQYTYTCCFGAW